MTRKEAIAIQKRWGAPGYSCGLPLVHEFGSWARTNPAWWAALVKADAEVTRLKRVAALRVETGRDF